MSTPSADSPPPSPLQPRRTPSSASSPTRVMQLQLSTVTNMFTKMRRTGRKQKDHHIESSSGDPITDPSLVGEGVISEKRIPLVESERFVCRDGVDVVKLLRAVRASLLDKAENRGANVLVEEQWKCTICGPRNRRDGSFRVSIQYSAQAARSERPDPQRPVALSNVRSVPGLMTILSRDE